MIQNGKYKEERKEMKNLMKELVTEIKEIKNQNSKYEEKYNNLPKKMKI